MPTRQVVIPVFDGIQPLDVTGPHEVFAGANGVLDVAGRRDPRYRISVVATTPGTVRAPSGLGLVADGPLPRRGAIDTLLLPGGDGARAADPMLVRWTASAAGRARRVATVCTGAFIAADAGLCRGRQVTTHWSRAGELAARAPDATVAPDAIYLHDGDLWSSAGVTAGIDLALALVEDDLGPWVAQQIARHLVVHLRRPGGQTQYAAPVWSEPATTSPIARARDIVHADPAADLGVPRLAAAVGLSERHFARLFRDQIGESPARYVERVRVEAARHLLEGSGAGLDEIARQTGFGSTETLRRSFHRRLGCAPDAYRRRAATTSA